MKRIKKVAPKPRPSDWEVSDNLTVNGRLIERGTEITVRDHGGQRRRVRFLELVQAPAGKWITVSELDKATGKSRATRSFSLDRILTVHRKTKMAPRPKKGRKG
jgi:hypothetical protein